MIRVVTYNQLEFVNEVYCICILISRNDFKTKL